MWRISKVLGTAVAICLFSAVVACAQDAGGGGGGGQGGRGQGGPGGRGGFDPAQYRQRMLDRIKEVLGVTDEEWKVLQPKVEAVQQLSQQTRVGGGMFGRFRRGGPPDANQARSDLEKKTQELQTLLDNKDADPKAVKDRLKEIRDLREKARLELKKAQDALRELLTPRQEAQLVLMGLLD